MKRCAECMTSLKKVRQEEVHYQMKIVHYTNKLLVANFCYFCNNCFMYIAGRDCEIKLFQNVVYEDCFVCKKTINFRKDSHLLLFKCNNRIWGYDRRISFHDLCFDQLVGKDFYDLYFEKRNIKTHTPMWQ